MNRHLASWSVGTALCLVLAATPAAQPTPRPTSLRIEVTAAPGLLAGPAAGRLLVVLGKPDGPEPRSSIGRTGRDADPIVGRDVTGFDGRTPSVLDASSAAFPIDSLSSLAPGEYAAQAVLVTNADLRLVDAPGNLYSDPVRVSVDPSIGGTIALTLARREPDESLPADAGPVRFVKIRSALLSAFHGRPIDLRAGVILPSGYDEEPARRYPLRVRIGGYGARFTQARDLMRAGSEFRKAWEDATTPRMILLHLDGAGPLGDPYQVNSANHGPYGDAITQELIPFVERTYRGRGEARARVLDGGSTGGWVSLALQVFYPDVFNGTWSYCPDGVDFRAFQLVNVYADDNAYVNARGFERPSARDLNGDVRFTMRHECQLENVIGSGDSWTMSGLQWGAWNATYGPRGADGRPVPLWDPKTGAIDRRAADQWKRYDLRLRLEENWATLGPKLHGKLRIWVGEADDYFLNNAVHLLESFLRGATPPYEWSIAYGPGKGHCWKAPSEREIIDQMAARTGR